MKKLVLFVLVVLVIAGAIFTLQNNATERNNSVSNIPEGFRKQNIPVFVCDTNPIVNPDAVCWELGK